MRPQQFNPVPISLCLVLASASAFGLTTEAPSGTAATTAPASTTPASSIPTDTSSVPEWMAKHAADLDSPAAKAEIASTRSLLAVQKDLKVLRAKFFRATKNAQTRALGVAKLREQTDPAIFPSLIEIFGDEDTFVQNALVTHLADQRTTEGDVALARCAVRGTSPTLREAATRALVIRYDSGKSAPPYVVQQVIADALRGTSEPGIMAAANLCNLLNLIEAIPMLIQAQAGGTGGASGASIGPPNGDSLPAIATIVIGQQQAFVSDLTPVVGNGAVGFNPTVSVLNTGTVMRIIDAHVITYRTDVLTALSALSERNWGGQSTAHLGTDPSAWTAWYTREFVPFRRAATAATEAAKPPAQNAPLKP